MQTRKRQGAGLRLEVALVWGLFALVSAEVLATYTRIPSRELYHVSGSGLEGGLSRALVFLNFPVALVALAVLGLIYPRLPGQGYRAVAILAAVLSAGVFWPGVVSQADLDARPVNAIAGIGVLLTLALTEVVAHKGGVSKSSWQTADWPRAALGIVLLVAALPWLAADVGLYSNGVPLLGKLFQSGQFLPERPGLPSFAPAVHHGHHHGMDGVLLVLTALLLSRRVRRQAMLAAYLSLMFCYGVANFANDFWIEQVVKRGWTSWEIPNVTEPSISIAWSLIVIAAVGLWALWVRLVDWSGDEESSLCPQPDRLAARR